MSKQFRVKRHKMAASNTAREYSHDPSFRFDDTASCIGVYDHSAEVWSDALRETVRCLGLRIGAY